MMMVLLMVGSVLVPCRCFDAQGTLSRMTTLLGTDQICPAIAAEIVSDRWKTGTQHGWSQM